MVLIYLRIFFNQIFNFIAGKKIKLEQEYLMRALKIRIYINHVCAEHQHVFLHRNHLVYYSPMVHVRLVYYVFFLLK